MERKHSLRLFATAGARGARVASGGTAREPAEIAGEEWGNVLDKDIAACSLADCETPTPNVTACLEQAPGPYSNQLQAANIIRNSLGCGRPAPPQGRT